MYGHLFLIPTPLGGDDLSYVLPAAVFDTVTRLDTFVVEEVRTARRYLSRAGLKGHIGELDFHILNEHTKDGAVAIDNFAILFEPALKINLAAFLKTATTGRSLVLKLERRVADDWHYYPFPEDHDYYLDLTGINTITC